MPRGWPSPLPLPFCLPGKWAPFFGWAVLWVSFPWIPWIHQVLWVPSLIMKSGKISHSLLIIIPALWALLAHSSTIPRLLSSSKFLFDPFPYLFLSSPSQTFPNRSSHNRSPRPSSQLPLNSHHPSLIPSIHQNNDKHHQRLPNQQASGLTDHPLSFSSSPSTPSPGIFPLIVPHSEKAHRIISLSHSTVSSQIECLPLYLEQISAYALSSYILIQLFIFLPSFLDYELFASRENVWFIFVYKSLA